MKRLFTACAILAVAINVAGCHRLGLMGGKTSIRRACAADIAQFCAGVDRSAIRDCMKTHADQLSAGCKAAIAARAAAQSSASSASAAAPVAVSSAASAAPANK